MQVWTTQLNDAGDIPLPAAAKDVKLALVFGSPSAPYETCANALRVAHPAATVLCATTAGEFVAEGDTKQGLAAILVGGQMEVRAAMSTPIAEGVEAAVASVMPHVQERFEHLPHRTCIVLVDPLAGHGEELVLIAAAELGPDVQFAGGAAGDDLAMKETHVGLNGVYKTGRAVFAVIHTEAPLALGVAHGHAPLSDKAHTVTKADGGVVLEVDGRPAWDVWVDETRAHYKGDASVLDTAGRAAFLLQYEAGLSLGLDQFKIRAPLATVPGGGLQFATAVPEGTVFYITESDAGRQRASASVAARAAKKALNGRAAAGAVVFDCICRNLILNDDFKLAVADMSEVLGGVPLAGFETYGEIALAPHSLSGFHNTTSVVLAFPAE